MLADCYKGATRVETTPNVYNTREWIAQTPWKAVGARWARVAGVEAGAMAVAEEEGVRGGTPLSYASYN